MRRLLRTTYNPMSMDIALLVVRLCIAGFMLVHGLPKLARLCSSQEVKFADPIGIGVMLSLTLTVFAEVFCSILVMIGLGTRFAVIPLLITMLVAAFVVHGDDSFSEKELSLHYVLVYGVLLVTGSGRFSLDWLLFSNSRRADEI